LDREEWGGASRKNHEKSEKGTKLLPLSPARGKKALPESQRGEGWSIRGFTPGGKRTKKGVRTLISHGTALRGIDFGAKPVKGRDFKLDS